MLLSIEDILGIAAGVAAGTIPAVVTYFLSERSARSQLEREQEYARRREKYEQVLFALRIQREATEVYQAFLRLHTQPAGSTLSTALPDPLTPSQVSELVMLLSKMLAIGTEILADQTSSTFSPGELFTAKSEDRERVFGAIINATARCLVRADLDVKQGLTSLTLADGSEDFATRAVAMSENLSAPIHRMVQGGPSAFLTFDFDWVLVEKEFSDLEIVALADLKDVLGRPIEVELNRATAPKSVEARPKTRHGPIRKAARPVSSSSSSTERD
jgi:hypothetical protein